MLGIRPTTNANVVLDTLIGREADLDGLLIPERITSIPYRYLNWVNECTRTLGPMLTNQEFDRLVLTRTYWALLAMGRDERLASADLVRLEVAQRRSAFTEVIDRLRADTPAPGWIGGRAMVVPDTNVWMLHSHEIETFPWSDHIDVRTGIPLVIWVPSIVLEELDALKRDRGDMFVGGTRVPRRTLARRALHTLTDWIDDPKFPHSFQEMRAGRVARDVEVRILAEEREHIRLGRADAELIDIAQRLRPYALISHVVTYDASMAFRARAIYQPVILLTEPDVD
jgi:hypothetical protein